MVACPYAPGWRRGLPPCRTSPPTGAPADTGNDKTGDGFPRRSGTGRPARVSRRHIPRIQLVLLPKLRPILRLLTPAWPVARRRPWPQDRCRTGHVAVVHWLRVGQRVVALRLGPAGLSYRSRGRCRRRRAAAVLWAWERSYSILLSSSNARQVCHTVWPVSMARWAASSAIVDNPVCRRRRCAEPGWLPPIAKGNETYTSEGAEGGSFRRVKAKNIFKGPVIWIVLAVLALLLIVPVLSGAWSVR